LALNALQNSIMFIPYCPKAGPTGGAGVAFPAEIWSLTFAITFFATLFSSPFLLGLKWLPLLIPHSLKKVKETEV